MPAKPPPRPGTLTGVPPLAPPLDTSRESLIAPPPPRLQENVSPSQHSDMITPPAAGGFTIRAVPRSLQWTIKALALKQKRTVREVVIEALRDVLTKYGMTEEEEA